MPRSYGTHRGPLILSRRLAAVDQLHFTEYNPPGLEESCHELGINAVPIGVLAAVPATSMDKNSTPKRRPPRPALNLLEPRNDQAGPGLAHGETSHGFLFPPAGPSEFDSRFWGNAKPPTPQELEWIKSFGRYPDFDPNAGKLSSRLRLEIANLKEATRIIVHHHYLHRGRTMAQLPYWVLIDNQPIGVLLFSLPRLSVPLQGIPPMNILELARMWLSPDVQGGAMTDSTGRKHAVSVASCAVGKALLHAQQDWYKRYPNMPDVYAVVSWADLVHHEGTVYRAANFEERGTSGGSMHGNRRRPNGGRDQWNTDYAHRKTLFIYRFAKPLTDPQKRRLIGAVATEESFPSLFTP